MMVESSLRICANLSFSLVTTSTYGCFSQMVALQLQLRYIFLYYIGYPESKFRRVIKKEEYVTNHVYCHLMYIPCTRKSVRLLSVRLASG